MAGDSTHPQAAKSKKAPKVVFGMVALIVIVGGGLYLYGMGHESTDDAQVDGHILGVSTRVGGQVAEVLVQDNQVVEAGAPLVSLDTTELDARAKAANADLAAAKAQLKSAVAQLSIAESNADKAHKAGAKPDDKAAGGNLSSSRAALEQAKADVVSFRSKLKLAQQDFDRAKNLRRDGVVSASELDARQSAFDQAKAGLEQAEAKASSARIGNEITAPAQVESAQAAVDLAAARVDQADAARRLAEMNLGYAKIVAPAAGIVSRRTVEVGQVVGIGTPLMAIVPRDDIWITANFKEDQLAKMRPGQRTKIRIDAYGRRAFEGRVDSLSGATGSKFALLPADNASGNFVKVVQRIPVKIKLDAAAMKDVALRPGMSADVVVLTEEPAKP